MPSIRYLLTSTTHEILKFIRYLKLTNYAHLNRGSVNLVDIVRPIDPVLSRRSYHQWWSMGATLIVDDPELAPVLSGTHLPTSEFSFELINNQSF